MSTKNVKPKAETMWAIMGVWHPNNRPFFYTGTALTRLDAIWRHTSALGKTWKDCRRIGDRAIKVKVLPA